MIAYVCYISKSITKAGISTRQEMGKEDRGGFLDEAFGISKSYFLAHPIEELILLDGLSLL